LHAGLLLDKLLDLLRPPQVLQQSYYRRLADFTLFAFILILSVFQMPKPDSRMIKAKHIEGLLLGAQKNFIQIKKSVDLNKPVR
jgi:hypothetical protein